MIGRGANGKSSKQWNILLDFEIKGLERIFDNDTPRVNNKGSSRKVRRRGNTRRKKNRDSSLPKQDKENMADPPDGTDQPKSKPVEEGDNQKMKRKSVLTNRPITEAYNNQNKVVKIYAPLDSFTELKMSPEILYCMFQKYILRQEDLKKNGFPPYTRDHPRYGKFGTKKLEDPTQRWCCRCGEKYIVTDDGEYRSDTICSYHKGKRQGPGPFSCCGYQTEGCMKNQHHVSSVTRLKNVEFKKTREKKQVCAEKLVYALDCEMCYTIRGMEVTRVSVVNAEGMTVYDSFVLPESPITDYNTDFSGITAKDLNAVKTTLTDVQTFLLKTLCAKTVLIGHALENDLRALHIIHETIVDTSVVFPRQNSPHYKNSLKSLAEKHLHQDIQCGSHDSVEDARTCVDLMLRKLKTDREVLYVPPKQNSFHSPAAVPQQWSTSPISINTPYNVTLWRPTLVSPCDFYLGGQVTA